MSTIADLIASRPLYSVPPDWSVQQAAELMAQKRIGAVPVVAGNRLVGIFSERDLLVRVIAEKRDLETTRIGHVMTRNLVVAAAGDNYQACLEKMKTAGCRHLPVVQDDKLLGIVSMRDLLLHEVKEKNTEIRLLSDYINYVPAVLL